MAAIAKSRNFIKWKKPELAELKKKIEVKFKTR
jgi:hypothetical protein